MLRLKNLRQKMGLSQTDVARALGVSRQSYNFYENGKRDPDTEMLKNIADYFNVSVDYLLGRNIDSSAQSSINPIGFTGDNSDIYELYKQLPKQKQALVLEVTKAMLENKYE